MAIGLARLGLKVLWLSRLTNNPLGRLIERTNAGHGVDTSRIIWTENDRVGLYFLEEGKPVFPFIYEACEMSFRLRRRQYITSSSDLLSDVAQIVDVLAGGNPTKLNTFVDEF